MWSMITLEGPHMPELLKQVEQKMHELMLEFKNRPQLRIVNEETYYSGEGGGPKMYYAIITFFDTSIK